MTSDSSITVTGGSYSLAALTDVDGSSLYAQNGDTLLRCPTCPAIPKPTIRPLRQQGSTARSTFPPSATLGDMSNYWHAEALAGGTVNLSGLTTIDEPNAGVQFTSNGSGSQLNLPALTSFTGDGGSSTFVITGVAPTVSASRLTTFSDVQTLPGRHGSVATSQWSTLTGGGSLTVTGGSYSLAA